MVKSARVRRTQRDHAASPVLPEDLVLWEIFYRLPAKEILRCRAVCRSWRRLTCDAEFLLAHHKHQPSLPLVLFNCDTIVKVPATVDALDLRQSLAVHRPILGFSSYDECHMYYIRASCDGLLILSRSCRLYYICNPTTRQWCKLPDVSNVTALYHHRPSGEYRVLYRKHPKGPGSVVNTVYYVLTVGSSLEGQRCIGLRVPSPSVKKFMTCTTPDYDKPPVPLHDCLRWYYGRSMDTESKVVVFDTVDESFRCMRSPIADNVAPAHLCQMDGTLGICQVERDTMTVQVWELQDYEKEVWSLKHRIPFPVVEMMKYVSDKVLCLTFVSESGDMLVWGHFPWLLFHYDSKGNLVDKFQPDSVYPRVLRLSLKESLVRHAFFEKKDRKRVKLPGFFQGI
uniref:Uncharacterized protein n=1 Tax=Avena sativa TaxID=4498 RepID=A0ACD5VEH0_AVESA